MHARRRELHLAYTAIATTIHAGHAVRRWILELIIMLRFAQNNIADIYRTSEPPSAALQRCDSGPASAFLAACSGDDA
jgi:hypothetical protein